MKKNSKNKNQLPSHCQKYFWDVDFIKLDYKKYPSFVIERLLEYGDVISLKWMFKKYSRKEIQQVVIKSRNLTLKSVLFWANFLEIDKDKILCLKKSYLARQKIAWPY